MTLSNKCNPYPTYLPPFLSNQADLSLWQVPPFLPLFPVNLLVNLHPHCSCCCSLTSLTERHSARDRIQAAPSKKKGCRQSGSIEPHWMLDSTLSAFFQCLSHCRCPTCRKPHLRSQQGIPSIHSFESRLKCFAHAIEILV